MPFFWSPADLHTRSEESIVAFTKLRAELLNAVVKQQVAISRMGPEASRILHEFSPVVGEDADIPSQEDVSGREDFLHKIVDRLRKDEAKTAEEHFDLLNAAFHGLLVIGEFLDEWALEEDADRIGLESTKLHDEYLKTFPELKAFLDARRQTLATTSTPLVPVV